MCREGAGRCRGRGELKRWKCEQLSNVQQKQQQQSAMLCNDKQCQIKKENNNTSISAQINSSQLQCLTDIYANRLWSPEYLFQLVDLF